MCRYRPRRACLDGLAAGQHDVVGVGDAVGDDGGECVLGVVLAVVIPDDVGVVAGGGDVVKSTRYPVLAHSGEEFAVRAVEIHHDVRLVLVVSSMVKSRSSPALAEMV